MSSPQSQPDPVAGQSPALPDSLPELRKLEDLLRPVQEKPENLDASHEDAHQFVRAIWFSLFGEQGPLKSPEYKASRNDLKLAWQGEVDKYESYTYALEIYQRHQGRDLSVAEAMKDKGPLVEERRAYIAKLEAFHEQAAGLKRYLSESPSSP